MTFLDELNAQQREAAAHGAGPLLVVAGAGSGKTRVITYRIAHLISMGIDPGSILGVTFTNKAAGEMRERVERMLGTGGRGTRGPLLCTFHSFCARLLRREAGRLGHGNDFTIYDETDSAGLIKRILKDLGIDPKELPVSAVRSEIEHAKIDMLGPEAYAASRRYGFGKTVAPIYAEYQTRLRRANAMDFDDLLVNAVGVLRQHPDALARWRERFRTMLVDEFQDTNPPQYTLVKLLAAPGQDGLGGNVCVVGDPDQSIYQWRGADIRHINEFEHDFPGTRVVKLEQNYRSTPTILRAANAVIAHNAHRHPKALWSERDEGERVVFRQSSDEYDEAGRLAQQVRELSAAGVARREMAVLYRTNAQSRVFEEVLMAERIPYVIVGTVGFYQRKEVKDVVAYLRLVVNPADAVSLERIINVPPRGIGQTTIERVQAHAAANLLILHEAIAHAGEIDALAPAARKRLAAFHELLERFRSQAEELGPADLARLVIEETGYIDMLEKSRDEAAPGRIENVEELVGAIVVWEKAAEKAGLAGELDEAPTLRSFLENIALMSEIDSWETESDRLNLMTVHNSKGLEFRAVFITGLEEGLFPHANSLDSDDGIEEERRLFYVALTRAKDRAVLSAADTRMRYGQTTAQVTSRFIDEIPEEQLATSGSTVMAGIPTHAARTAGAGETVAYEPGDRVVHPTFGEGEVLEVASTSAGQMCAIRFRNEAEPRTVATRFARLTKLG